MVAISPHVTRATGTILTASMYNGDHGNHIANAQALNSAKTEKTGVVVDGHAAVWDGIGGNLKDGGPLAVDSPPWDTADYNNDSVTYAKIQNVVADDRFLGRISGANGDIEELTGTQATTLLDPFTSALKGLVPASGGGTANFLRADVTWAAPVSGDYRLLNSGSVAAAAQLDIVLTSFTAYKSIKLELQSFVPATDQTQLYMRFSTDGGASYVTANNNYSYANMAFVSDTATFTAPVISGTSTGTGAGTGFLELMTAGGSAIFHASNVAAEGGVDCVIDLWGRTSTARRTGATWDTRWTTASSALLVGRNCGGGIFRTAQDTDAIRILFSTGNITSGTWALYGSA